jgi:hypothetical protein
MISNEALKRMILNGVLGGVIANEMLGVKILCGVFGGMEVNGVQAGINMSGDDSDG